MFNTIKNNINLKEFLFLLIGLAILVLSIFTFVCVNKTCNKKENYRNSYLTSRGLEAMNNPICQKVDVLSPASIPPCVKDAAVNYLKNEKGFTQKQINEMSDKELYCLGVSLLTSGRSCN